MLQRELGDSVEFDRITQQPGNICFGQMRPYQIESLQWMAGLYHNGMNGILADEMGLGKTLQSIAILAHLAETHNVSRGAGRVWWCLMEEGVFWVLRC